MRLVDLSCKKPLIITNNNLLKEGRKKWTLKDPKRKMYFLDYVLINSKLKKSVVNVEP